MQNIKNLLTMKSAVIGMAHPFLFGDDTTFNTDLVDDSSVINAPTLVSTGSIAPAVDNNGVPQTPKPTSLGQAVQSTAGTIANNIGQIGGTFLGNIGAQIITGIQSGIQNNPNLQTVTGNAGANVVTSTLSAWFKKNWMYVTGGAIAFFGLIWLIVKRVKKSK